MPSAREMLDLEMAVEALRDVMQLAGVGQSDWPTTYEQQADADRRIGRAETVLRCWDLLQRVAAANA